MNTITMWLESPKKAGQIELTEDEITYNLEDFLNDLIYNGFDTFKLYSGVTNSGPIGLIAKVENGEIIEMDIDEYSQIIGEDIDITDLYTDKYEDTAPQDIDMIYAEKMARVMLDKGMDKDEILDTLILSGVPESLAKSLIPSKAKDACKDTDDVFIKDDDYDKAQVKAYKMLIGPKKPFAVIYAYNQGKGKEILNPPLAKKSKEEVQDFLNGFRRGREGTKVVADVFYASQIDEIKNSLISRKLIKNDTTKDSINDSKGYDIMQLCKRNNWYTRGTREEYDHLLYGVDDGLSAEEAAKDIVDHSRPEVKYPDVLAEVKKIIKDSVKDSKLPEVDDWVIEEAKKIVMAGYDDEEDLLDKIQDLSNDLTPRNVLDIYKYLKHTMKGIDSTQTKNKKYNRNCGHLVTDSLKDADDDLTTGRSYFKAIRKLLYEYLGTDENYGDQWIQKDNSSVIDMYSWVEKQEPEEDYKKFPKKTLKLEQQEFESILNNICEELNCTWERSYEGTSEGSSAWFHDGTDYNKNKEYDDYCIADYRIILPEGITEWVTNDESTNVDLSLVKDSKKVKDNKAKWKVGDETVLTPNMPEYKYMEAVTNQLNELSNGKVRYYIDDVYLDAGQDWMWTTIIAKSKSNLARTWQVLSPKQWLDIVNGKPTDEVVKEISSGDYFNEK